MLLRAAALLTTMAIPVLALASDGGDHGHDGPLTLHTILHGEHSLELVAAVVNFIILIFIIHKLASKPLANHLTSQRKEIEDGMREAADMKAKAEAAYKEYNERLETLDDEVAKLRSEIEAAAELEKTRIVEDAKADAVRIKADTEAMVERHASALSDAIRREVVEASIAAAEETLRKALTSEDQRKLADNFSTHLGESGNDGGPS